MDCADTEPLGEYFDSAGGSGDVTHNRADGFVLSASPSAVSKGEALVLTLENVSAETLETGGYGQFAIQRRTDDGWKHVLSLRRSNFTSIAFRHRPGGGFRWAFTVSERGFSKGQYTMCTPLKPGEYRFVYWGLSGEKAVATRFRIGE
ncbi:hypothetical protein ACFO0N_05135 [Halobium salinum]|uniref:Uncharacterized protein n=1 Tax=Halobium salinum TaxID=1364940 RepID=A0ABD5P8W8_9EURY|nr:hypothetical protein [Halobium salinum]